MRGAPVNEHESIVRSAPAGEVVEYLFDGTASESKRDDCTQSGRPVTSTQRSFARWSDVGPPWLEVTPFEAASECVSITTSRSRAFRRARARQACRAVRTRLHVPFFDHRRNWTTLVQGRTPRVGNAIGTRVRDVEHRIDDVA